MTKPTQNPSDAAAQEPAIYIEVTKDGPYLVFGHPTIRQEVIAPNEYGQSWDYVAGETYNPPSPPEEPVALCRCGRSKNKPFCDGSHTHGFDGTETASKEPIVKNAKVYQGPKHTLLDNEAYCAFARFCDAFGQVWNLVMESDDRSNEIAVREACQCPAGRLMMVDHATGRILEFKLEKSIGVLEDPRLGVSGPLYVKGSIPVKDAEGQPYEVRNRQTLCRCGRSANKPFCDGSHAPARFQDELPLPDVFKK